MSAYCHRLLEPRASRPPQSRRASGPGSRMSRPRSAT
jgi:hypothetical protein